jgi:hypothetical protein
MKQRFRSPLLISVIAHVLVVAGLVQLFRMPNPLRSWLEKERKEFQVERIGFLSLPAASPPTPGRRGGDNRPETEKPPVRPPAPSVVADPAVTPSETPATEPTAPVEGGSGPLIGGGGALRGIQPSFNDPRLWTIPDQIVTAPKSPSERLDSVFADRVAAYTDSVAKSGPRQGQPNWAKEIGGRKYGIDSTGVYIAGILVPVIPFLPPLGKMDDTRRAYAVRSEILQQSQRRMNEDEFRRAAQKIRERKDRERQERQAEKEIAAPIGSSDR